MRPSTLAKAITRHPEWTLQRLGDSFGVTRQAVYDMLKRGPQDRTAGRPQAPVSPSLRAMSAVEAAYVGALVDTDGCVDCSSGYWHIQFANNEVELVAAPLRLTGVGRIQYRRRTGSWEWKVGRINDVRALMEQLQPFSLKIQRALAKIGLQTP